MSQEAVRLAKAENDKVTQFKYRLAYCLTKRRLGDYNNALADLDSLFEELIVE